MAAKTFLPPIPFEQFKDRYEKVDRIQFRKAVAAEIVDYKDTVYPNESNDHRYLKFFRQIKDDTAVAPTPTKRSHDVGQYRYERLKRGYDFKFTVAVLFWFTFHPDANNRARAERIERKLRPAELRPLKNDDEASEPAPTEPTQSPRSSPQPILHFPEEEQYEAPATGEESTRSWLSPLVTNTLPFVGREAELTDLDSFLAWPQQFMVWAISGPFGAGKTRIVTEWMRRLDLKSKTESWDIGFLTSDLIRQWQSEAGQWTTWAPTKSMLIAVDYLHLLTEHVYELFNALDRLKKINQTPPGVVIRVLLIDHTFPLEMSEVIKDSRLRAFSSRGALASGKETLFYKKNMLVFDDKTQSNEFLYRVMSNSVAFNGAKTGKRRLGSALSELRSIKGAWNPLFAALRGSALAKSTKARFDER